MANECQERLMEDDVPFPENGAISNCRTVSFFRGGGVVKPSRRLPSFMLIKYTPNCIEIFFFFLGTFIYKMGVMDEVRLALCFGLKETEEGFINTYTCHPACPYRRCWPEREEEEEKWCICLHAFSRVALALHCFLWVCFGFFFAPVVAGIFIQKVPPFSLFFSGITFATKKWTNLFPLSVKISLCRWIFCLESDLHILLKSAGIPSC